MIANGKPPAIVLSATIVVFEPLFHVGASPNHCIFLSEPIRIQLKLSDRSPPPRAKVSICTSPGATSQAMTVSPDRHGTLSLSPPPFRPERLFEGHPAQSSPGFP